MATMDTLSVAAGMVEHAKRQLESAAQNGGGELGPDVALRCLVQAMIWTIDCLPKTPPEQKLRRALTEWRASANADWLPDTTDDQV